MDVPKYLDFDLLIERTGERYKARVISAPTGTASRTFDFPFNRDQLQIFLLSAIGLGRNRKVRKMEAPEMKAVKIFGGGLFEAVFAEDLLECLRLSLYDARRESAGLRIRLRLDDAIDSPASDATGTEEEMTAVALCDVPWEFMFDAGGAGFLSLSIDSPVVRYQDLNTPVEHISVDPPLRLLVAICAPSNAPELDVAHERAKVEEALSELVEARLIQIDWLEHATLKQLQRALYTKYHAFHFIGHGGYDERAQTGALLFENANGFRDPVGAEFLRTLFQGKRSLQLALLNACEGSRTDPRDPFAGVAQSLVRGGVAAVIAMQFEISDEAAIALSSEFYSALAHGFPVDAALSEARKAVYTNVSPVEWAIPVLYLRSPDASIFDLTAHPEQRDEAAGNGQQSERLTKRDTQPPPLDDHEQKGEQKGGDEVKKEDKEEGPVPPPPRPWRKILVGVAALAVIAGGVLAIMAITGDGPVPPGESVGPSASLDGDVVFLRNGDVFAVDPSFEAAPRLLVGAEANDYSPSLSRDGTKIVFGGGPDEDVDDIFMAGTDGSGLVNLTRSPTWNEETAAWSPDGSKIAFDREVNGNFDIYVMNADGSGVEMLTNDATDDKRPEWAPDGSSIAFEGWRSGDADIWLMDVDGTDERPLFESHSDEGVPVWSPESDRIAFRSDRNHRGDYEVWVVSADGGDPHEITHGIGTVRAPSWSPDGTKIVYSEGGVGQHDLYTVDVEGGATTPLLTSPGNDRGPTWCCY